MTSLRAVAASFLEVINLGSRDSDLITKVTTLRRVKMERKLEEC